MLSLFCSGRANRPLAVVDCMMQQIRAAALDDLPTLAHLWHEKMLIQQQTDRRLTLMGDAQTKWVEAAAAWLADESSCLFVADMEGVTAGYILGQVRAAPPGLLPERLGFIVDMALNTHYYAGGMGRRLVRAAREWFEERGVMQVVAAAPYRSPVEQAFWRSQHASEWVDWLWLK
jgi:GNAT superfamily N-acetyltransferase